VCVRRTLQQETDSVNKLQAAHLFKLLLQNVCRIAARVPQVLVNNRNQIIHFSLIARRIHLVLLAGSQNCACFVDAPFSLCNLPQAGAPSPHLPGSPSLERAAETAFQLPYCHMKSVLFNLSWPSAVGLSDSVSDCFFFHCLAVKVSSRHVVSVLASLMVGKKLGLDGLIFVSRGPVWPGRPVRR